MHMHGTIKNNYKYTHIWVQIIINVKITHLFRCIYIYIYEFYFFFNVFLHIHEFTSSFFFFFWAFDGLFYRLFVFCITLTHLEQQPKKKKLK